MKISCWVCLEWMGRLCDGVLGGVMVVLAVDSVDMDNSF